MKMTLFIRPLDAFGVLDRSLGTIWLRQVDLILFLFFLSCPMCFQPEPERNYTEFGTCASPNRLEAWPALTSWLRPLGSLPNALIDVNLARLKDGGFGGNVFGNYMVPSRRLGCEISSTAQIMITRIGLAVYSYTVLGLRDPCKSSNLMPTLGET